MVDRKSQSSTERTNYFVRALAKRFPLGELDRIVLAPTPLIHIRGGGGGCNNNNEDGGDDDDDHDININAACLKAARKK